MKKIIWDQFFNEDQIWIKKENKMTRDEVEKGKA